MLYSSSCAIRRAMRGPRGGTFAVCGVHSREMAFAFVGDPGHRATERRGRGRQRAPRVESPLGKSPGGTVACVRGGSSRWGRPRRRTLIERAPPCPWPRLPRRAAGRCIACRRDGPPPTDHVDVAVENIVSSIARESTPVFDWAGETARRVGSLVHAELQLIDLQSSDEAAIKDRAEHYRRWLALARRAAGAPRRCRCPGHGRIDRGSWRSSGGDGFLTKGYRDDFREHALSGYLERRGGARGIRSLLRRRGGRALGHRLQDQPTFRRQPGRISR